MPGSDPSYILFLPYKAPKNHVLGSTSDGARVSEILFGFGVAAAAEEATCVHFAVGAGIILRGGEPRHFQRDMPLGRPTIPMK